jgi:hypothetical protein
MLAPRSTEIHCIDALQPFHLVGCKTEYARRGPATGGRIIDPREYLDRDEACVLGDAGKTDGSTGRNSRHVRAMKATARYGAIKTRIDGSGLRNPSRAQGTGMSISIVGRVTGL